MTNDQTILDVVCAVTHDLRHTESFRALLRPLSETEARRVAQRYIAFLYQELGTKLHRTTRPEADKTHIADPLEYEKWLAEILSLSEGAALRKTTSETLLREYRQG